MRGRRINTEEQDVAQSIASEIIHGDDGQTFEEEFETVDTPNYQDVMAQEAFMNEMVKIVINESDNPDAEQIIATGVNGRMQYFVRGVEQWVKRCYVEVLARAKVINYRTPEYTDPNGNRATSIKANRGLKYNFTILEDKNSRGRKWLQSVMQEA